MLETPSASSRTNKPPLYGEMKCYTWETAPHGVGVLSLLGVQSVLKDKNNHMRWRATR